MHLLAMNATRQTPHQAPTCSVKCWALNSAAVINVSFSRACRPSQLFLSHGLTLHKSRAIELHPVECDQQPYALSAQSLRGEAVFTQQIFSVKRLISFCEATCGFEFLKYTQKRGESNTLHTYTGDIRVNHKRIVLNSLRPYCKLSCQMTLLFVILYTFHSFDRTLALMLRSIFDSVHIFTDSQKRLREP